MDYMMQKTISKLRIFAGIVAAASMLALLPGQAFAQSASADGEVRKLDVRGSRVIIKHGEWKGMDMHAMTMAFRVKDSAWLSQFKEGERIRFAIDGDMTVVRVERAK